MPSAVAPVPRPPLVFRVGVAGVRSPCVDFPADLRSGVASILQLVGAESVRLAGAASVAAVYQHAPDGGAAVELRVISSLADGADRLVAEEGLKLGARLDAPLPFSQSEYEKDFPQTLGAFRDLANRADILELDGARGEFAAADSYLACEHFVVHNCDLLIAISDENATRGRGGLADIIRLAARNGVLVWWIDASATSPPKCIASAAQLRRFDKAPSGDAAAQELARHLQRTIAPPNSPHLVREGVLSHIAHHLRRAVDGLASPLDEYLAETPRPDFFLWRAYAFLMDRVAPLPAAKPSPAASPANATGRWWEKLYETADRYSIAYSDRYRSSYVLIALLAVIALSMATVGGTNSSFANVLVASMEVASWSGIGALVVMNYVRRWHERWISYRLLAEICRKQCVLSSLGWSLANSDVMRLALEAGEGGETSSRETSSREFSSRETWVAWYFAAAMRAAPFPTGSFAALKPRALEIGRALIAEQRAHHQRRQLRNAMAGMRIARLSEGFFLLTFAIGISKLVALFSGSGGALHWAGVIGGVVSAGSGAFVGIRAYSEFSLLARQSAHMLHVLKLASAELDAIAVDQPLTSRELGRALFSLSASMMQDISGWAQMFRVKNVDAG